VIDREALALGRFYINRDPLSVLEELRAAVSYAPHLGYCIVLGKDHDSYLFKRLTDCIAFNTGGDTNLSRKKEGGGA
jgi:hypothetical protein